MRTDGVNEGRAKDDAQERDRCLAEAAIEGIVIAVDGRVVAINAALSEMFGYTEAESLGRSPIEFIAPADQQRAREHIARGWPHPLRVDCLRKDGSVVPVEAHAKDVRYRGHPARATALRDLSMQKGAEQALARSEAQFREVLERAPEIVVVHREGRVLYGNVAARQAFGFAEGEAMEGVPVFELVAPDERARALERTQYVQRERGALPPAEFRYLRRDGTQFVVDCAPMLVEFGGAPAVMVLSRDVTERARQAAALREAEEQFRATFEHAPTGMAVVGLDGRFLRVNRALADIVGYTPDELEKLTFQQITHPEDLDGDLALVGRLVRGEIPRYELAKRYLHRDGRAVEALLHVSLVRDASGAPRHFISQIKDVTEARRAERALRENEQRFRALATHVPVGIFETDANGTIVFANERWCEMMACTPEDTRKGWRPTTPAEQRQSVRDDWDEVRRAGQEYSREMQLVTRDGRTLWAYVTAAPLRDEAGRVRGYLGSVLDVTERKKFEAQLVLNDRLASVGTLAAGVAHEINNPLSYVTGNLDLLAEALASLSGVIPAEKAHEVQGMLRDARGGAERVRRIVRGLRTFSRADEDRRVSLSLFEVLDLSIDMVWNEIRHRARLVRDYRPVPHVEADEARLGQVFVNLLVNAAQSLPAGHADRHEIRVSTHTDDRGRAVVEVRDTGGGIPREIRGRIFDPFFTTKAVGQGSGLGLAICHGIVTSLGGEITVESEVGRGSTFSVALPGVRADVPARAAPEASPARDRAHGGSMVSGDNRSTTGGRVLVVDDEPLVASSLKHALGGEHDVTAVNSGREALALVESGRRYDTILCDLMMPTMTGMDLHAALGRIAPDQQARMVFMTGGAFTTAAREFLDRASNPHVEKPFEVDQLRALVRRVMGASRR